MYESLSFDNPPNQSNKARHLPWNAQYSDLRNELRFFYFLKFFIFSKNPFLKKKQNFENPSYPLYRINPRPAGACHQSHPAGGWSKSTPPLAVWILKGVERSGKFWWPLRSQKGSSLTIGFLLITFYIIKVHDWALHHRVLLVKTRRMMYFLTLKD